MQGNLTSCLTLHPAPSNFAIVSAAAHRAAAVMADVAVSVAAGYGAAVVAGGCVGLEIGELFAAGGGGAGVFQENAGAGQEGGVDVAGGAAVAVAVCVTIAMAVRVAVLRRCRVSGVGCQECGFT